MIPGMGKRFFLQNYQMGSRDHPASLFVGYWQVGGGGGHKWPKCDVNQAPSSNTDIRISGAILILSLYTFMACTKTFFVHFTY